MSKAFSDYRVKDVAVRKEAFIRWFAWSLRYGDCDPAVWMTDYLHQRFEHNREQRLWFCWLYANTYHLPTAWILIHEFPDFELATVDRLTEWNTENFKRLRYQTDTKYNKGHLPVMFASYQKAIGNVTQEERLRGLCPDASQKSFDTLWKWVCENYHKFGRYLTWFYCQHLYETAGIPVVPYDLRLSDYSGSRSHRNGLLYALALDHKVDEKLSPPETADLEVKAANILHTMQTRFADTKKQINPYRMETALCSFKKLFRTEKGRYLGYYLDRQSEEIQQVSEDGWPGINWHVLWQARAEMLDSRLAGKHSVNKTRYPLFLKNGKIDQLDWMFNDEKSTKLSMREWF